MMSVTALRGAGIGQLNSAQLAGASGPMEKYQSSTSGDYWKMVDLQSRLAKLDRDLGDDLTVSSQLINQDPPNPGPNPYPFPQRAALFVNATGTHAAILEVKKLMNDLS